MKILNPLTLHALPFSPLIKRRAGSGHTSFFNFIFLMLALVLANITYAQKAPSSDARTKLMEAYKQIKNPEISFSKFFELNSHIYANDNQNALSGPGILAPQDLFCGKIRAYCTNGDFESGLDQTQYSGSYGSYSANLYPNPFSLTNGFLSGVLTSSAARQTIVLKTAGIDPVSAVIPLVASNGGNQSLRLGNAVNGTGTEVLAKTVVVDANESILSFYYALVLQDPGHSHDDQPAFSVRAYDCATGLELPNVCNLGNGSNIAVADAGDPFFQSKTYQSELLVYRDWSLAQVNLSAYIGKTVTVVFTNKDCNLSGHFGYTYLDNLFSGQCPAPPIGNTNQGIIKLDNAHVDSCGVGNICTKYSLPFVTTGGVTTTGDITITLNIYQNGALAKTISSGKLTTRPADSSYCFPINPATLGINMAPGGFDYTVTAAYTLSGFALPSITLGNPGTGVKNGTNNDYLFVCASGCNVNVAAAITSETDNNADGAVTLVGTNGTAPYTYMLNGVSNATGVFTGLSAGSYPYSVTDAANCTKNGTAVVNKTTSGSGTTACPADTVIMANPATCTAVINWTVPSNPYPDSIAIAGGTMLASGVLQLKGTYNGHGYYQSNDDYSWPDAKTAAGAVNSHLVTITDAGESSFIKTQLPQPDFGAWIGLSNTGTVGNFAWVTGEPFSFSDWNYAEPNNENGTPVLVNEPYVHIRGVAPNDRWNDAAANWNLQFIAEYDNPVLTYTQTSGPAPGSTVPAGEYTICYEIKNSATNITSTCCFKVTVVCNSSASGCPKDTTIVTTSNNCLTTVKWALPAQYPDNIAIPGGTMLANGALQLRGVYNGHGYYQSNDDYSWPDAKAAASSVTGHLVSITDAGESAFIKTQLAQPDFGAWIGLFNTGSVGNFAWVTGEPVSFTDWNYSEPNNENGTAALVNEPYVHIRGVAPNDRWNDASANWNLQFIAEFDNPILTYTQISGIPYGSTQAPGVYPICYEITNTITGVKTTCCFKVTVVCSPAPAPANARTTGAGNRGTTATETGAADSRLTAQGFVATVYPNPSNANTAFSIRTQTDNNEKVSIKVIDIMGRTVEAKPAVQPNSTVIVGSTYKPGMYFIQVVQGTKTVTLRLTKQ
ncbi:MAG: lectin-like protein [Chitinophagaceae bacterium]